MLQGHQIELENLGFSTAEAQIYLALLHSGGSLSASAVIAATGIPRSSVYPTLNALVDKGFVEAEAGYRGRFSAVLPERALPSFVVREKEELLQELSQREHVAGELAKELQPLAGWRETNGDAEVIQVLRDPRVIGERFERLQLEAERQVELFVKAPIFNPRSGNPTEAKGLRRGVRYRCLYERAIVDAPAIGPYIAQWIASGEEARVHEGELPHKLAIVDRKHILMPLITPSGQGRTLLIRHPQLAGTLGIAFDSLWERAKAIPVELATPAKQERGLGRNGRRASSERTRATTAS